MRFQVFKDIDKANNFIVGYLIYFISTMFIGFYYAIIPVMIVAYIKESLEKEFNFESFGHTIAGMIPALLIKIGTN